MNQLSTMRPLTIIVGLLFFVHASTAQTRVALVEVYTATWCPACPAADVTSDQLIAAHPSQVLVVAVHGDDAMMCMGGSYLSAMDHGFLPSARVDRTGNVLYTNQWAMNVNARLNQTPVADVSVDRTYNPATRMLTATVNAHFLSGVSPGDYRLSAIVVEDDVTGTNSGYAQQNQYAGGGQIMGGYENLPDPVPAADMEYDNVARELLGGYNGVQGSVPASPQAGQTYSHTFTYTIPATSHDESVRVYGLLTKASTNEVLNAGASLYAANDVNDIPFFVNNEPVRLLIGQQVNVDIEAYDNDLEPVQITAVSGLPAWANLVMTGPDEAELTGTPTAPGTFNITLQVSDGEASTTQQLVVQVDGIFDPWLPLGTGAASPDATHGHIDATLDAATSTLYVAHTIDGSKVKVRSWDGTTWVAVGGQMSAYDGNMEVAVTTNTNSGKPWVAYAASPTVTRVSRYTGTTWTQVGELVPGAASQDMVFSADGLVYLATSQEGADMLIHTRIDAQWAALGGNTPITIAGVDAMGWPRLALTPEGAPVVAFRGHNSVTDTYHAYVGRWNGVNWDLLGGAAPCPVNERTTGGPLSFQHIAIGDNGSIHVAVAHNEGINVYTVDADNWTYIGSIETETPCTFSLLVDDEDHVILTYTSRYDRVSCTAYDGSNWSNWGDHFTPHVTAHRMTTCLLPDGNPAVLYADLYNGSPMYGEWLQSATVGLTDQPTAHSNLRAYPVPTASTLRVDGLVHVNDQARILDVSGRMVASLRMQNGSVDVAGLDRGSYIMLLLRNGARAPFVRE